MLKDNLRRLIESVEIERLKYSSHHIIKIVAVSKYVESSDIIELYNAGQRAFGENKVQDFALKSDALSNLPIEWHFIGSLQENKINKLLTLQPYMLQSLDSLKLANALQKRLSANNQHLKCLLQINSSLELSKSGFRIEDSIDAYKQILQTCPNISLQGVMTIGANTQDKKIVESCFKTSRDIFDALVPFGATILSCGMSDDYQIAIANGANLIRIGSKIFQTS